MSIGKLAKTIEHEVITKNEIVSWFNEVFTDKSTQSIVDDMFDDHEWSAASVNQGFIRNYVLRDNELDSLAEWIADRHSIFVQLSANQIAEEINRRMKKYQ